MKKLDSEKLNAPVYVDATNIAKNPVGVEYNLKNYLLFLANDVPTKTPLTRARLTKLGAIDKALASENVVFEDADLKFLSDLIDEIGVLNRKVYAQIVDCLDSAVEFKP